MEIKVDINDEEVKKDLAELQGRMKMMTPVMKEIGQIVRTSAIRNFEAGGRPKWNPSQRVKKKGGMTLIKSHRLMNSISATAYPDRVEIGTNVIYGAIHQLGGAIAQGARSELFARKRYVRGDKKGQFRKMNTKEKGGFGRGYTFGDRRITIPARPFLMVQNEDWVEIKSIAGRYLLARR